MAPHGGAPYTQRVADDDKLDALVGAALKGLVEAGASAAAVGAFAASYRTEAAQILGLIERPSVPDLQVLVTEAVSQALAEAGVIKNKQARRPRAERFYVMVAGKHTSVTISAHTTAKLIEAKGSKAQAKHHVEQLANSAPASTSNRSKWIEERILAGLTFAQSANEAAGVPRH